MMRHKKTFVITLMMLPGAIWLLLLRYLPMFGIITAFKRYRAIGPNPTFINNILKSEFVGLDNFRFITDSPDALRMIRNTVVYNIIWIFLVMVVAIAFAVMLSEITKKFVAKVYQTIMFFPYFLSWVVVSYFVYAFLDPTYGLLAGINDWYNDPTWWPLILTIANLWKVAGYSCILYLAAITGIDAQQYEAAAIDGATKWQQIWHVTIPNIRTMIVILFIMNIGKIFNADFGLFYNVPKNAGALFPATQVIDTYVYRALENMGNIGMSTAAGLLQNTVGFVFIMVTNGIVRKVDPESALF
ncbi:MAG: ABC transporter permease subunit [Clostridiales bacterium]|jgi:putative aldouronate transport system permease protein|nr:ABC transporter permease subunit [Clostridiales bacterium]